MLGGCQEGTPRGVYHHSLSLDPSGLFLPPGCSEFKGLAGGGGQVGMSAWGVGGCEWGRRHGHKLAVAHSRLHLGDPLARFRVGMKCPSQDETFQRFPASTQERKKTMEFPGGRVWVEASQWCAQCLGVFKAPGFSLSRAIRCWAVSGFCKACSPKGKMCFSGLYLKWMDV